MGNHYDEEQIARMAAMWAAGDSARVIGEAFGKSRSAILGLAHRRGDLFPARDAGWHKNGGRQKSAMPKSVRPKKPRKEKPAKAEKPSKAEKTAARRVARSNVVALFGHGLAGEELRQKRMEHVAMLTADSDGRSRLDLDRHALPDVQPVAFKDLKPRQCKFTLSRFHEDATRETPCCGAPAEEGKSYCSAHMAVVYKRAGHE